MKKHNKTTLIIGAIPYKIGKKVMEGQLSYYKIS